MLPKADFEQKLRQLKLGPTEMLRNKRYNPDLHVSEYSKDGVCQILRLELKFLRDLENKKLQFSKSFQYRVIDMLQLVDPLRKGFIDFEK